LRLLALPGGAAALGPFSFLGSLLLANILNPLVLTQTG
jgi:hypothetical protein